MVTFLYRPSISFRLKNMLVIFQSVVDVDYLIFIDMVISFIGNSGGFVCGVFLVVDVLVRFFIFFSFVNFFNCFFIISI